MTLIPANVNDAPYALKVEPNGGGCLIVGVVHGWPDGSDEGDCSLYCSPENVREFAEACIAAADEAEGVTTLEADPRPQQFISVNVFVDGEKVSADAR